MSKFTTEVRRICETYADDATLSIEETITAALPYIFTDIWNATDEERKIEIEKKILRHYYTQEIGFETVPLWKLRLNSTLSEIMPKYNLLYTNLDTVRDKLFSTVDVWENTTNESTSHSESTSNGTGKGTTSDTAKTTGTQDNTQTSDSTTSAEGSGNTEAWQKYNDTPQGGIDGLDSDTYLTNATKNVNDSTNKSSSTGNTTANGTQNTTTETTSSGENSTETTDTSSGDSNASGQANRHIIGKNSGGDYLDQYLKLMTNYEDIDRMIISDLQPLFMGLWE